VRETWSITFIEEHRLGVFYNRVLRRIFRPKRNQVTGEWRRIRNEELYNLDSSTSIIRVIKSREMRWVGDVTRMGKIKIACRVLVEKTEGNIQLGKPWHRWKNTIRVDGKETDYVWGVWTGLIWLRIGTIERLSRKL